MGTALILREQEDRKDDAEQGEEQAVSQALRLADGDVMPELLAHVFKLGADEALSALKRCLPEGFPRF